MKLKNIGSIIFYSEEEIDKAQIGYRYDSDFNKLDDWINDDYMVIGKDTFLEHIIVINAKEKDPEVFIVACDDYTMYYKIADSITVLEQIIEIIKNTQKDTIKESIDSIKDINENYTYWEEFLYNLFEI